MYNLSINFAIAYNEINDIVAGALETGGGWVDDFEVCGEQIGEYATDQIAQRGELRVHDGEQDKWHILNLEKLLDGIKKCIENGYCIDSCGNCPCSFKNGKIYFNNADAVTYDNILQYALFGEIIYG